MNVKVTYDTGKKRFLKGTLISEDKDFYVIQALGDGTEYKIGKKYVIEFKKLKSGGNEKIYDVLD